MALLFFTGPARAADTWPVEKAPVRFTVQLASAPTHESAGYYLELPDGGILPSIPEPVVMDAAGAQVKSYVVWHNRETGLGVVFEAPKTKGDVTVYVAPASGLKLWTPASGLTPSALLFTHPGPATRQDAMRLAKFGSVDSIVHVRNRPGGGRAPLSVPGNLRGGGPCSLYMQAYLNVTQDGSTWVAPLVFAGSTEVRIDSNVLAAKKVNNKPGGSGQAFNLSKGLHRLEILAWSPDSGAGNGLMTLIWKPPGTPEKELGGNRASDLPYPNTPMWEARPLRDSEIVRSGHAAVRKAEAKEGGPVARVLMEVVENFWLGDEQPLLVCKLTADNAGHPSDTRYTWSFGDGSRLSKREVFWFFSARENPRVNLVASSGKTTSTCTVPVFPFTTRRTNLNSPDCRENFRRAALDVFEAYPADQDPTAGWDASHWANFFRTLELNSGQDLLTHLFRVRWNTVKNKLSPGQRYLLQEVFLDFLARTAPEAAMKWTETFEQEAGTGAVAGIMKILRAEICMYYLGDLDRARKILDPILLERKQDEVSEWARIRYGDIEFLARDLNKATQRYGDVQNRAGHTIGKSGAARTRAPGDAALPAQTRKGLARTKEEMEAQRKERMEWVRGAATASAAAPSSLSEPTHQSYTLIDNERVADWKMNALVEASASEKVKSLVAQGFLLEAKRALQEWERNFPLSKVSSDYIINEARFYMAMQDWTRAEAMLEAYCEQIDASSFIPPAVEALLTCKLQLKEPREPMIAFCEKMKKKLEFHPAVKRIDDILFALKKGN